VRTLAYCHKHRIPVTPRGGGTGNYGQACRSRRRRARSAAAQPLPVAEGRHRPRRGRAEADRPRGPQPAAGLGAALHPSTRRTATIGASSPAARAAWARSSSVLRTRGNVLGLRLITMEAEPRAIELRGEEVMPAVHAYGTNGIIVELEIPLARSWPWHEAVVSFVDIAAANQFAKALCEADGIVRKLVSVCDWGAAQYFRPLLGHLKAGEAVALCVVADPSREAFTALAASLGGTVVFERDARRPATFHPLRIHLNTRLCGHSRSTGRLPTCNACSMAPTTSTRSRAQWRRSGTRRRCTGIHPSRRPCRGLRPAARAIHQREAPLRDHPLARDPVLPRRRSPHYVLEMAA